jgi:Xaa-Pro dipeptidase
MPLLPKEALERYDIDKVLTTDDLKSGTSLKTLLSQQQNQPTVHAIPDRADLTFFNGSDLEPSIDLTLLRPAIEACRVQKDAHEIALIRHANIISSHAHTQVLLNALHATNERELNALFVMHCHANGCREQAYGCICAAGSSASTLHYVHNDLPLKGKLNLLLDAGAEYACYCSDITRTFPLTSNGKFTPESKQIYELVLKMQSECMTMIRAGVQWEHVHMRAHEVCAEGLRDLGVFKSSLSTKEILDSEITTRFFPHGLGHYLGMDTHDVGGNANYEDINPFFKYLRIRGKLPENCVVTNEPGVYFREFPLVKELEEGKWEGVVDREVLKRFWSVGGVRIEDDIWVKEGGCENLTTVRSEVEWIEGVVQKGLVEGGGGR